mmetsp:Transcript_4392/g.9488  ORF Transcript_4392/g.9488 Transcript_4392/m.9488 type:complete len:299 (+) Transcript_4392:420-1316(+)
MRVSAPLRSAIHSVVYSAHSRTTKSNSLYRSTFLQLRTNSLFAISATRKPIPIPTAIVLLSERANFGVAVCGAGVRLDREKLRVVVGRVCVYGACGAVAARAGVGYSADGLVEQLVVFRRRAENARVDELDPLIQRHGLSSHLLKRQKLLNPYETKRAEHPRVAHVVEQRAARGATRRAQPHRRRPAVHVVMVPNDDHAQQLSNRTKVERHRRVCDPKRHKRAETNEPAELERVEQGWSLHCKHRKRITPQNHVPEHDHEPVRGAEAVAEQKHARHEAHGARERVASEAYSNVVDGLQ